MMRRLLSGFALSAVLGGSAGAEPIPVQKPEGVVHGFLVLRSPDGEVLADGDLIQVPIRGRIESRLTFRFRDGSLHDERLSFSQDGVFRLESYHLVQKGPSFPDALDATLDRATSSYVVRHRDEDDDEWESNEGKLELPADAYNGMFFTLLKNVDAKAPIQTVSMVAWMPEPRMVSLEMSSLGQEPFAIEDVSRRATHYLLDIEVEGLTGVLAELLGKDPPPLHTWMLGGDAPTFVRFRGFLYPGGPVWSIELASPVWPGETEP
jgi:hypothetical protein